MLQKKNCFSDFISVLATLNSAPYVSSRRGSHQRDASGDNRGDGMRVEATIEGEGFFRRVSAW